MKYPEEVLNACPNCGSSGVLWHRPDGGYFVECNLCGGGCARTSEYERIEDAIKAWNERNFVNESEV